MLTHTTPWHSSTLTLQNLALQESHAIRPKPPPPSKQDITHLGSNDKASRAEDDVKQANDMYLTCGFQGTFGGLEHFHEGLDGFSTPLLSGGIDFWKDIETKMEREMNCQDEVICRFTTHNYGSIQSDLRTEWEFVVAPRADRSYPGQSGFDEHGMKTQGGPFQSGGKEKGRRPLPIESFLKVDTVLTEGTQAVVEDGAIVAIHSATGPLKVHNGKFARRLRVEDGLLVAQVSVSVFVSVCLFLCVSLLREALSLSLPAPHCLTHMHTRTHTKLLEMEEIKS